jgi:hypothetical protein
MRERYERYTKCSGLHGAVSRVSTPGACTLVYSSNPQVPSMLRRLQGSHCYLTRSSRVASRRSSERSTHDGIGQYIRLSGTNMHLHAHAEGHPTETSAPQQQPHKLVSKSSLTCLLLDGIYSRRSTGLQGSVILLPAWLQGRPRDWQAWVCRTTWVRPLRSAHKLGLPKGATIPVVPVQAAAQAATLEAFAPTIFSWI